MCTIDRVEWTERQVDGGEHFERLRAPGDQTCEVYVFRAERRYRSWAYSKKSIWDVTWQDIPMTRNLRLRALKEWRKTRQALGRAALRPPCPTIFPEPHCYVPGECRTARQSSCAGRGCRVGQTGHRARKAFIERAGTVERFQNRRPVPRTACPGSRTVRQSRSDSLPCCRPAPSGIPAVMGETGPAVVKGAAWQTPEDAEPVAGGVAQHGGHGGKLPCCAEPGTDGSAADSGVAAIDIDVGTFRSDRGKAGGLVESRERLKYFQSQETGHR